MRWLKVFVVFLGLTAATVAWAAFTPSQWQYRKEISVQQTGYLRLNLDAEAFAGLQGDLRDLRVVTAAGTEVPFQQVVERRAAEVRTRSVTVLNNAYTVGQYQSFMVDLSRRGEPHNWLSIITPEREFQHQVEISGSDDQQTWQVLKSDGYIFAHHEPRRNFAVLQTDLGYPTATFRYLLVKVFSTTPFRVNGVEVTERVAAAAKEVTFTPAFTQAEDVPSQSSVITLDFGQSGLPTHAVTLHTDAINFDRSGEVFGSDDGKSWRLLSSGYLFRIRTPKFTGGNLTLSYPETAVRFLRIPIFNGDDQPVRFTSATALGTLRSVVFNAAAGERYFLYYGNPRTTYPRYDLERLFPYLAVPPAVGAVLGPQQLNPAFVRPAPPVVPLTERVPWLLPAVLVAVALGLLALLYRFVKQVQPPH